MEAGWNPVVGEMGGGGAMGLVVGVSCVAGLGMGAWGWESVLEAASERSVTVWTKLAVSAACLWFFAVFLWCSYRAAARRPDFPNLNDVFSLPVAVLNALSDLAKSVDQACIVLQQEFHRRGIGRARNLLYIKGTRFWATLLVLVVLSALTTATEWLLEEDVLGPLGCLPPIMLLVFYLEWVNLCAIGNYRPVFKAHFDEHNILTTHPPDRPEIPAELFDPPTPVWTTTPDTSSSNEGAVSASDVFGPKEKLSEEWKKASFQETPAAESEASRKQREEFERKRDAHYNMGHIFKRIDLDAIPDDDSEAKAPETGASPASGLGSGKEGEWEVVSASEAAKRAEAGGAEEEARRAEFRRKRDAHYAHEGRALKADQKEVQKRKALAAQSESEKRDRHSAGASPTSNPRPGKKEEEGKEGDGEEEEEGSEEELVGGWTEAELGLMVRSQELLSGHFLRATGEETLLPESGSLVPLVRYLQHQIRLLATTADILHQELANRQTPPNNLS